MVSTFDLNLRKFNRIHWLAFPFKIRKPKSFLMFSGETETNKFASVFFLNPFMHNDQKSLNVLQNLLVRTQQDI